MKRSDLMAYTLVAGIAILPVGVRALLWQRARQQPVDAAIARAGQTLFLHEWTPRDPLAAGGDGLGPVFNATSCVACHRPADSAASGRLLQSAESVASGVLQPAARHRAIGFQDSICERRRSLTAQYTG